VRNPPVLYWTRIGGRASGPVCSTSTARAEPLGPDIKSRVALWGTKTGGDKTNGNDLRRAKLNCPNWGVMERPKGRGRVEQ